ncbi:MAG: hypothetical protein B6I20_00295 [Bacteroidetes bacterium 4572_117]|nr:MAG: hypothetical protein B6I20_00295 [Bacteroidetes bacterium 4572_117]
MEEKDNIDKYTAKILKHLELEKPLPDFTEKIMDKVLSEQTEGKKIEAFGNKNFPLIFTSVFLSIILLAVFLPSGEYSIPESLNVVNGILSQIQIDFSFNSEPIFSTMKDNAILKILPLAIIALILFERLLLRYSDSWKEG